MAGRRMSRHSGPGAAWYLSGSAVATPGPAGFYEAAPRSPDLHDPELERLQDRARAVAHAKLGEDVRDMILDGSLGDAERVGDLLVAVAAGHEAQDLGL